MIFKNLKKQLVEYLSVKKSKIINNKKFGFSLINHTNLNIINFLIKYPSN